MKRLFQSKKVKEAFSMANLVNLGHEIVENIPELKPTFSSIHSVFGELTFAARMEKKLTQKELAERTDVSVRTIQRMEGGSGGITDKTYEKVFTALEITNDDIADSFRSAH